MDPKTPEKTKTVGDRLRTAGYRVTRQRLAVYEFVSSSDAHPTVVDIHTGVVPVFPKISVATVYRSLESLVDVGLVKPIHLGSAAMRFDAATEKHGHFRCLRCNQIVDVPVDRAPIASVDLDRCDIIGSTIEFYGFCPNCKE